MSTNFYFDVICSDFNLASTLFSNNACINSSKRMLGKSKLCSSVLGLLCSSVLGLRGALPLTGGWLGDCHSRGHCEGHHTVLTIK
jgi:hypothetical protein